MLYGATDEILRVLKSESYRDKERKKEVEGLIGKLSDANYALLVNLSKKITDFHPDDEDARENVWEECEWELGELTLGWPKKRPK